MKLFVKIGILSLIVTLAFSSCDPGYEYTEEIANNSSETLDFFLTYDVSSGVTDTLHIPAHTRVEILNDGGLGSALDFTCGQVFAYSTFQVKTTNNKMLIKDVTDPDNWTSTSKKKVGSSEKHCVFTIEDSDLQ